VQPGVFGHQPVELARGPRCFLLRVENRAAPNSVVAEYERSRPHQPQGGFQVIRVTLFVGVDEDEVEGVFAVFDEVGEEPVGVANPDLYDVREASPFDVVAGDVGVDYDYPDLWRSEE